MPSIPLEKAAPALLLSLVMVACGPPDEASRAKSGPINGPFVVSNFFTPSGFMGDGAIPDRLTIGINENCKKPRPAGAQGDCYHFIYRPLGGSLDAKWAGAYWVYPTNSWGTVPGRKLIGPALRTDLTGQPLLDMNMKPLRGYTKVRFYGAVDPLPKGLFVQVYAGGIDGRKATPAQPYFDHGCLIKSTGEAQCEASEDDDPLTPPAHVPYFFAKTTGYDFTGDWVKYEIDLTKWSMESVIGAFGWATSSTVNLDANGVGLTQSLYFDDIVWE